jgi:hypothetical protein
VLTRTVTPAASATPQENIVVPPDPGSFGAFLLRSVANFFGTLLKLF